MRSERLRREERAPRIAIHGSYGGMNLGDEAILHAMVAQLRRSLDAEITVFSRNADDTTRRHAVDRAIPIQTMTRAEARNEVAGHDLLLLGGGGILFDAAVESFLREVALALDAGVPVMAYAIGAGPLTDPTARGLVKDLLNRVAVVTVRDRDALRQLEEVGVEREIEMTADPALLLEPDPLPADALTREGLADADRLFGFSVREPGPAAPDIDVGLYHGLLADAADFLVDRLDGDIVFVPMEKGDIQHAHAVLARMQLPERATILKGDYTPGQLLSWMECFDFAVGMRLHFLIFAAQQGIPLVGLPYASKVTGFLDELGLEMPPLRSVSAGRLIAHIDRSWDMQGALRARIRERVPEMQRRAARTHDLAVQLVAGAPSARRRAGS